MSPTPEYGQGKGGWRKLLVQEAAVRVEEGLAQPGQETFLQWLVRRGGELAPPEVREGLRVVAALGD